MVKIRLRRIGAKKAPFYLIVVADSRFAASSKRSATTIRPRSPALSRSTPTRLSSGWPTALRLPILFVFC